MKKIMLFSALLTSFLTSAQNVGIGTTTPGYRLHVVDATNPAVVTIQASNGDRAELKLMAGTNFFNDLFIQKYHPGTTGTFGGYPKDNLSVISTGGNGGALVLGTGDGVSPLLFVTGTGEKMRVESSGQVAIGTTVPAPTGKLHLHDDIANQDVSIVMTNSLTGPGNQRGMRLRLLNSDLNLINYETGGKLNFVTGFVAKMTIDAAGNVGIGIGNSTPSHKLEIVNSSSGNGINLVNTGSGIYGANIEMPNLQNNIGLRVSNPYNYAPGTYGLGIHAIAGSNGLSFYTPTINYAVVGECLNTAAGLGGGILGISNSASPGIFTGGVLGNNFSTDAEAYGVVGLTASVNGAGVVGRTTNGSIGVFGLSTNGTGPAIKAEARGTSTTAIEINNGAIKVAGGSKPLFQITAQTGVNISSNQLIIPNTTQANSPNDLLIVTPVFGITGVYLNKPIGVWWNGFNWTIFIQDLSAMPNGAIFNVMVVKQ